MAETKPVCRVRPRVSGFGETNLDYLTRRAIEESRLAGSAASPAAAAAHRYLAAAYSAEMAKEIAAAATLKALLTKLP